MATFTIGDVDYRSIRLDGRTHLRVTRCLAGVLDKLAGVVEALRDLGTPDNTDPLLYLGKAAHALEPMAWEISRLNDADLDLVLTSCMAATKRKGQGEQDWSPVQAGNAIPNEVDRTTRVRFTILWFVLRESFGQVGGLLGFAPLMKGSVGRG